MTRPFIGVLRRRQVAATPPSRRDLWIRALFRRLVAAALAATALVVISDAAVAQFGPATRSVVVVDRDVPVGALISEADVTTRNLVPAAVPDAAFGDLAEVVGRRTTSAVDAGEMLTPSRLRATPTTAVSGRRSLHIPILDAASLSWVHAGDHVDVHSATGSLIASDVVIVAVDEVAEGSILGQSASGGGVVVSLAQSQVAAVTAAAFGGSGPQGVALAVR